MRDEFRKRTNAIFPTCLIQLEAMFGKEQRVSSVAQMSFDSNNNNKKLRSVFFIFLLVKIVFVMVQKN